VVFTAGAVVRSRGRAVIHHRREFVLEKSFALLGSSVSATVVAAAAGRVVVGVLNDGVR